MIWGRFAGSRERKGDPRAPEKGIGISTTIDRISSESMTTRVEKTIIAGEVVYDASRESGGPAQ